MGGSSFDHLFRFTFASRALALVREKTNRKRPKRLTSERAWLMQFSFYDFGEHGKLGEIVLIVQ